MRPLLLLFFLLTGLCPLPAQHSFIAFYPDTAVVSLAATVDSAGEFDGTYCSYYRKGQVMDSGQYSHGVKTGYWLYRQPAGFKDREEWFSPVDSSMVRTKIYDYEGKLLNTYERIHDQAGEISERRKYNWTGQVKAIQYHYDPPRGGIVSVTTSYGPQDDTEEKNALRFYRSRVCRVGTEYSDGRRTDSLFDGNRRLMGVETDAYSYTFHFNGRYRSYMSRDTECTWYDNGQLLYLSAELRANKIAMPLPQNGEILPSGFTRYWTAEGELTEENYDFPLYLPPLTKVRLCNESGKLYAEGMTDEKGLKNGSWRYYAYTASGEAYTAMEGRYSHGCREGAWRSWYEGHQLKSVVSYAAHTEKVFRQSLYNDSRPRGECDRPVIVKNHRRKVKLRVNQITGYAVSYFPDGKKKLEYSTDARGVFTGTWSLHDSTGTIVIQRRYEHGRLSYNSLRLNDHDSVKRIIFADSTGLVKEVKKFRRPNGTRPYTAEEQKLVYDPFWFFIAHTDGLGKAYIASQDKAKQEYKSIKRYWKIYKGKPMEYAPRYDRPWIKPTQ